MTTSRPVSSRSRIPVLRGTAHTNGSKTRPLSVFSWLSSLGSVHAATAVMMIAATVIVLSSFAGRPPRPLLLAAGSTVLLATPLVTLASRRVAPPESRPQRGRSRDLLERELERSRRHGHEFTLVRIACRDLPPVGVASAVRSTDEVWVERGDVFVLLPETERGGAAVVANRIENVPCDAEIRLDSATFPSDGLTERALLERVSPNGRHTSSVSGNGHDSSAGM